jgi:PAS domain S-box-containing protein
MFPEERPLTRAARRAWKRALTVAAVYVVLSVFWVLLTANWAQNFPEHVRHLINAMKGTGFVVLTGGALAWYIFREMEHLLEGLEQAGAMMRPLRSLVAYLDLDTAPDEERFCQKICDALVERSGYQLAWVGRVSSAHPKVLFPLAQRGFPEGHLRGVPLVWESSDPWDGPPGRALRSGEPEAVQDIEANTNSEAWRIEAQALGYASMVALPTGKGAAAGEVVICIYSALPDAFVKPEVEQLHQIALALGSGLERLRLRRSSLESKMDTDLAQERSHTLLHQEVLHWRNLHEATPTPILVVNPSDGKILEFNAAALQFYGYAREQFMTLTLGNLTLLDPPRLLRMLNSVLAKEQNRFYFQQRIAGGDVRDVEMHVGTLRESGTSPRLLCLVTDMTSQGLRERQAHRAQRLESIGNFAAGIAHDMNNVLAPILLNTQMLMRRIKGEREGVLLKQLEAEARRGGELVRRVLSFARGAELESAPFDFDRELADVRHLVRHTLGEGVRMIAEVEPGIWPACGDRVQLGQVLVNLILNARDAMPEGGNIRCSVRNAVVQELEGFCVPAPPPPGRYIRIEVSDEGVGIPPEVMDRLFEPFFTTKSQTGGCGLGLSSVLGIVQAHGGAIHVASQLGQGSTLSVFLPVSAPVEDPAPPRAPG